MHEGRPMRSPFFFRSITIMTMTSTQPNLSAGKMPTLRHLILLWVIVAALEGALLVHDGRLDSFLWNTTRWVMGDQDAYKWENVRQEDIGSSGGSNPDTV